jgi:hypothetical protein
MAITIPPNTRAAGQSGHIGDHNNISNCLTSLVALSVLNTGFAGGADPTGAADSGAAFNAALAAAVAAGGGLVSIPAGIYKIITPISVNVNNTTVRIAGAGRWVTFLNMAATGDCLRMFDTSNFATRTNHGSGVTGITIDGTSAGIPSNGLRFGDIFQAEINVAVRNFLGAGSNGILFDNQNFFCEQMSAKAWVGNCTTCFTFNEGGALTSTGSFERGDMDLYINSANGQAGVVFQNGAFVSDGRLGIHGNVATTTFMAVLTLTGTSPGGHPSPSNSWIINSRLDIGVEMVGSLGSTIFLASGSNLISSCYGVIDFSQGAAFANSNANGNFQFTGPVSGDTSLVSSRFDGTFSQGVIVTGATLAANNGGVLRVGSAANITGLIMPLGLHSGQQCLVMNVTAFTMTFAASGTSNVADGAADVIAASTARGFVWDSTENLWFRLA